MRIVFNFIRQLLIHIENWKICGHMDAWRYIMCFNMFKSCEVTYVRFKTEKCKRNINSKIDGTKKYFYKKAPTVMSHCLRTSGKERQRKDSKDYRHYICVMIFQWPHDCAQKTDSLNYKPVSCLFTRFLYGPMCI